MVGKRGEGREERGEAGWMDGWMVGRRGEDVWESLGFEDGAVGFREGGIEKKKKKRGNGAQRGGKGWALVVEVSKGFFGRV